MSKQNILIVEDDIYVAEVYATKLSEMGFKASVVRNGKEALEMIEKERPNLMLLDILMPEMDGMELLGYLKEKAILGSFPIILLTNLNDDENIKKAQRYGVFDYLVKSHYTPAEVIEKINTKLGINNERDAD